jgi:hypothetical protein
MYAALLNVQIHWIHPNYKLSRRSAAGHRAFDRLGFLGRKQLPPFSDPSKSEGWRGYIARRCMNGVRERRDFYVRTIRWDVTWRAHCDEATREELALVIWQDYSDVVNWNVAF